MPPKETFTPRMQEGMVRLGTWMPFRQASRELEFFTHVKVNEETVRHTTERVGAVQVDLQDRRVAEIKAECPESPAGPDLQMMSVDGCFIRTVGGDWKESKTLALGEVGKPVEKHGELVVHTEDLSYYSRMSDAKKFEEGALVEIHERGVEKAGKVCAVTDGAEWITSFVDAHRSDAIRILDFAHAMEYIAKVGKAVWEQGLALELLKCEEPLNSRKEQESQKKQKSTQSKRRQAESQHKQLKTMARELSKNMQEQPKEHDNQNGRREQEKEEKAMLDRWLARQAHELKYGAVTQVLQEIERLMVPLQRYEKAIETLNKSLNYLKARQSMMTYALFRSQGYPIGSGCIESANKLVVENRMKGAGMSWAEENVNPMLALRNMACSNRWDSSWKQIRQYLITLVQTERVQVSAQRLTLRAYQQKEILSDNLSDNPNKTQEEQLLLSGASQETPITPATQDITHTIKQCQILPSNLPIKQDTSSMPNTRPAANHPWRRPLLRQRPAS